MNYNEERFEKILGQVTAYLEDRENWNRQMRVFAQTKREMFQPAPVKPEEPSLSKHQLYGGSFLADSISLEPEYIIKLYLALALKAEQSHGKYDGLSERNEIAWALIELRQKFQDALKHFGNPHSHSPSTDGTIDEKAKIALDAIAHFFSNATENQVNLSAAGMPREFRHARGNEGAFVFNDWSYKFMAGMVHELGPSDVAQGLRALAGMALFRPGATALLHSNHFVSSLSNPTLPGIATSIAERSSPEALVAGKQALFDEILDKLVEHGDVHVAFNDKLLAEKIRVLSFTSPFSFRWNGYDEFNTTEFLREYRPEMVNSPELEAMYDGQLAKLDEFYRDHHHLGQSTLYRQFKDDIVAQHKNMIGSRARFAQIEAERNPPPAAPAETASTTDVGASQNPSRRKGWLGFGRPRFGRRDPK